jgi:5-methylthioribose kinase
MMDIEQPNELFNYLRVNKHIAFTETPQFSILAGGVSNRTVLIERRNGETWVIKQALTHLRTRADWSSSPERIQREALGIRWLQSLTPTGTIPALVFQDRAENILAMRAVPEPHANWKDLLLEGVIHFDYFRQFGELLGIIHQNSYCRRAEIEPVFRDRSFFESLRIDPYYRATALQVPAAAPFFDALICDTARNAFCLVHGDYSPKNILIYQRQLVLLDHEVIHWGDPAFDVGFSLTHLLSKAHHLPHSREELRQAAQLYWQFYINTLGDVPWASAMQARSVRHTLACLLARVDGQSPLEYLDEQERAAQRQITIELMQFPPETIPDVIDSFVAKLDYATNPTPARA